MDHPVGTYLTTYSFGTYFTNMDILHNRYINFYLWWLILITGIMGAESAHGGGGGVPSVKQSAGTSPKNLDISITFS